MKTSKKRTPTQQHEDEVDVMVDQVREWVKQHPTGNVVNLSTSPKLKKALDEGFPENWDAKKKKRIYMNYNGFMSFVYHFISKEHGINVTCDNWIYVDELVSNLFPGDKRLENEEYDSFKKIFLPLLNYLTSNYRIELENVLSLEDHVDNFKEEKVQRDGFFATDPALKGRLLGILRKLFTLDFESYKKRNENTERIASWDMASWMTCNFKHVFSYDLLLCDPSSCYNPLQQSLVDSLKSQNPSCTVLSTAAYVNKRAKK
jgi:hypothetical protein